MFKFFLGTLFGAGAMYYGSEKVADSCARAMWASEQTLKNQEAISQKALEQIAQWATEGTLQEKVNQIYKGQLMYDGSSFR